MACCCKVISEIDSKFFRLHFNFSYGFQGASNFVLFPLNESGFPEEKGAQVTSIEGSGPHPERQDHSYCHQVLFHKNYLYIVDLGTDTISTYRFNDTDGSVELVGNRIRTEPGAGPRHLIFHPNKPLAFACNELNSTTNVYRTDAERGQLEPLQTIKTRREEDEKGWIKLRNTFSNMKNIFSS